MEILFIQDTNVFYYNQATQVGNTNSICQRNYIA